MITWPIFVGFILALIAVYVSIKLENANIKKEEDEKLKAENKRLDFEKRKQRIENEMKSSINAQSF